MSITFAPAMIDSDILGYAAECWATGDPVRVVWESTYATASEATAAHKLVCAECDAYGIYTEAVTEAPEVNMANSNAAFILSLLGVEFDYCGSIDAAELAERVAFAGVVGGGDTGTATVAYQTEGGATMVECGRPVGYADERLGQLAEVAAWAVGHGRRVTWG